MITLPAPSPGRFPPPRDPPERLEPELVWLRDRPRLPRSQAEARPA